MAPQKALGLDSLPAGFLKTYSEPLVRIVVILITKYFQLEWFPKELR